ncbi:hypothetical protein AB6A40_008855 [Gnathostoma spinigerum]|uniref:Calponin-homology (CH) domain-containing protein n=1 Tax=Gnathostoma spinigerum TaxID=75299 RepID=A0ABD6EQM8_9BILA
MDRSWKDGVAFNALVHRSRPDVVDMEEVLQNSPRQNLEQAFHLADEHLHIRPLLAVEDMMCEKPDKLSVITYVSQFIKAPKLLRPVDISSPLDDRSLVVWIERTLSTYENAIRSPFFDQYEIFMRLRREYFDHRHAYNVFRENATGISEAEGNRIDNEWRRLGDLLMQWGHALDSELPDTLSEITQWLCSAEHIVRASIELRVDEPMQTLDRIIAAVDQHKAHFTKYALFSEKFQSIYLSGKADGKDVSSGFLEPIKIRMDILSGEAPRRLDYLHFLSSHYQILAYVEVLNEKIEKWKSGDSLMLVQSWIIEYKTELADEPERKLHHLLGRFKEVVAQNGDEDQRQVLANCEEVSKETVEKFRELRPYLESLLSYWKEFESSFAKVDSVIRCSEEARRNLMNSDANNALRRCEHARDGIVRMSSSSGREIVNQRLAELRGRVNALSKYSLGGRLVNIQQPLESAKITAATALPSQRPPKHVSRIREWIANVSSLMHERISSLKKLEEYSDKIMTCQRDVQAVESERLSSFRSRAAEDDELMSEYRRMKNMLKLRAQSIRDVRPLFVAFEKKSADVSDMLTTGLESGISIEKVRECEDMMKPMKMLVESLGREEYEPWVDLSGVTEIMDDLMSTLALLRETEEEVIGEDEMAKIISEKEELIRAHPETWLEYEQQKRNVEKIDEKSTGCRLSEEELKNLNERWEIKEKSANKFKELLQKADVLEKKLADESRTVMVEKICLEIDDLIGQCDVFEESLDILRDMCLKKLESVQQMANNSSRRAEQRINELSLVGEADLNIAVDVLKASSFYCYGICALFFQPFAGHRLFRRCLSYSATEMFFLSFCIESSITRCLGMLTCCIFIEKESVYINTGTKGKGETRNYSSSDAHTILGVEW